MQENTPYLEFGKKFIFFLPYLKSHYHSIFLKKAERIVNIKYTHFCMTTVLSHLCREYRLTKTKYRHNPQY